jgi:hypothetical protein
MTMRYHCPAFVLFALCAACAPGSGPTPSTSPPPDARTTTNPVAGPTPLVNVAWPVRTREHLDLWLHAYALLLPDSTLVPYFDRGYRDRALAQRHQAESTSLLDSVRGRLLQRIALNPSLATSGQFLPLYFESWNQMHQMIDLAIRANGNPGATSDPASRTYIAIIASAFPAAADREWLRTFTAAVDDENRRFYLARWTADAAAHARIVQHVDSLWQRQWRPAMQRFLNNTQQQNGELLLSLPLGGEGRTVHYGKQENAVAVPMPASLGQSDIVLYVMAHEVTGSLASAAIEDNTSPADRRAGVASRYEQSAAVRAGALLLERILPTAVPGYMRYYLQQAGRTPPPDARASFATTFALPDTVRDAIARQLDVILGGI